MISNGRYYVMYSGTHKYAVQLGERTLEGFRMLHVDPTASKHRHAKRARVIFLVIGSRSICRTVHSNDLVKFFGGLRCTARRKLEIYNM